MVTAIVILSILLVIFVFVALKKSKKVKEVKNKMKEELEYQARRHKSDLDCLNHGWKSALDFEKSTISIIRADLNKAFSDLIKPNDNAKLQPAFPQPSPIVIDQQNRIIALEKELYEEKKKNRKPFNVKVIFVGPKTNQIYECYSYNDLGNSLLFYDNDEKVIAKAKDYLSFEVMK